MSTPDPLHNSYPKQLPKPSNCEGHTHCFPNNAMVCVCGRIDRRKKMMK